MAGPDRGLAEVPFPLAPHRPHEGAVVADHAARLVAQAIVHGDGRAYCTALIAVDGEALKKWAAKQGLTGSHAALAGRPELRAVLDKTLDQLNAELPSYSTIKKFAILPGELTVEAGELTPSLKIKRRAIEKKYRDLLDGMYPKGE